MPGRVYLPLLQYLAALPPAQPTVTLPFAALDALIGKQLSVGARTDVSYWTSSPTAHRNWRRAGWTAHLDGRERAVTFTRAGAIRERRPGETKYAPLLRHLAALPADQSTVALTLAAIEASIGAALPPGARTPGFWSGTLARLLHRAGWRAALDRQRAVVTCRRFPADALRQPRLDHAAILAAHAAGASVPAVARRLGIDTGRVYRALRRAGIPLRRRR